MFAIFSATIPIFALIFAGWVARRINACGAHATLELNRFVINLALPALLFRIVAHARWADIWQPGFLAAFGLGVAVVFIGTVVVRAQQSIHLADAAIDGLNAAYANTGFMGFPLAMAILGPAAMGPALAATIITVCLLFGTALLVFELTMRAYWNPRALAMHMVRSLGLNPILLASILGGAFLTLQINLPRPLDSFLQLLGGAASPCALVALGLFLGEKREAEPGNPISAGVLISLKLIGQPLITWLFAHYLFHLPREATASAVLLAALPTGTGPFLIAKFYDREVWNTSRTVLISTVASVATIAAFMNVVT